jgi:4-aminobutyrate aminotransferase/(S)-3-amino-2-methylpropionate transaminase
VSDESSPQLDAAALVSRDERVVLRPWSDGPIAIVDAKGCIVTAEDGKQYLDFTTGYFVNNAGHCNPRVIQAATEQMHKVCQVSGKQTTPPLVELAERLVARTPKGLDKVFFVTGGSEANENALKMARQYSGKPDLAALYNGFHGLTLGVLPACSSQKYRDTAGIPLGDYVYYVPTPYCYRCEHADDCALQCLDEAEKRFDQRPDTAAVITEPVQAVGGIIPPESWWKRFDEMRRERGILLILDEVQTGMGRTGTLFALEHYGLEPEILTAGKGLSGGVGSLAVVIASDEVSANYFSGTTPTSAGNAVSAAAGIGLIEAIEEEGLIDNCARMGEHFTEAVWLLDDPWVRFKGLLGGVELVASRDTKEVLPKAQVAAVWNALQKDGMLITVSGLHGNVLRLQPPLCITAGQIDAFVDALGRALPAVRANTTS